MVDCTGYSNKAFLQLLKGNPAYQQAIANEETWEKVIQVIDSLEITYTQNQIEFLKENQWDDINERLENQTFKK